jgi:hypothetical protein
VARTVTVALRRGGAQLVFEAQKGTNSLQSLLTAAWVLLFSLVILFDRPLSHPAPGS